MDIVSLLEDVCTRNENIEFPRRLMVYGELFKCIHLPSISLNQYFSRVKKYMNCEESTYQIAYTYIERLNRIYPIQRLYAHTKFYSLHY